MKIFEPDYRHIVEAAYNRKPERLPLYEHLISEIKMQEIINISFASLIDGNRSDKKEFFRTYCSFFQNMGYDVVSYEGCVVNVIYQARALKGEVPGPIQNRDDFEKYPFDEIPEKYFREHGGNFQILAEEMPVGMRAVGGVGNGPFEIAQDLVGYMNLCLMSKLDPELYADLFRKIGEVTVKIWRRFLDEYGETYAVCRFGDDLGFKVSTLISPQDIRMHIIPQYKRIVELIHNYRKPFLWHSCGAIFEIMEDMIEEVQIDAKHSNEDQIAHFSVWIEKYGNRIGNFGGVDMNIICMDTEDEIKSYVKNVIEYSMDHGGFAVGSGNSIPDYVPAAGYLAMVEAVREYRGDE